MSRNRQPGRSRRPSRPQQYRRTVSLDEQSEMWLDQLSTHMAESSPSGRRPSASETIRAALEVSTQWLGGRRWKEGLE